MWGVAGMGRQRLSQRSAEGAEASSGHTGALGACIRAWGQAGWCGWASGRRRVGNRGCLTGPSLRARALSPQAILSWQDRAASACFLVVCIAAALAVQVLGFPTVLCVLLMWQIRPPVLRDPIPPRPVSYFLRLPCTTDEIP